MLTIYTELEEYPDREVIIHASALPLKVYVDQVRMQMCFFRVNLYFINKDALEFLVNFIGDLSTIKIDETSLAEGIICRYMY